MNQKRTDYLSWDDYFMSLAFLSAMRSKDPCTQVGACIVNSNNKVVAIGYNGMPCGCSDDSLPWMKESSDPLLNKYMYVCHAEMNAIMNKSSSDVKGCVIYVALFPCNECAKLIIQSGISKVVYFSDKHYQRSHTIASKRLLDMAKVKLRNYVPKFNQFVINFLKDDSIHSVNDAVSTLSDQFNGCLNIQDINKKRNDYLQWSEYFMAVAFLSAMRSKDPITQVGACIVDADNKITGIGYNGMPLGCSDDLLPWGNESSDPLCNKYLYVCHGEMNAILNKNCADIKGCTIYVVLFPCNECTKLIIQSGIKEVLYFCDIYEDKKETIAAKKMLSLAGVTYKKFKRLRNEIVIYFNAINNN